MEAEVQCPYCGETISVWVDAGGGGAQSYVEDCSVCCRPIDLAVVEDEEGNVSVQAQRGDD